MNPQPERFPGSTSQASPSSAESPQNSDPERSEAAGRSGDFAMESQVLVRVLTEDLQTELNTSLQSSQAVIGRIALEVERICNKSDRIQTSGQIQTWQLALARHRLQKCIVYYKLGSRQGRVELHSMLSAIVYRYVAPSRAQLGFQARYTLIEDFLQGFYAESLKAFRRENQLPETYTPRTRLELAEYMAFSEQYAKRRITIPGRRSQQLIVLRVQGFANRQPQETTLDIELATQTPRGEDAELHSRSPVMQQLREQLAADAPDPTESVLRDRVISELVQYLEEQGQPECVDYLTLKLQDLSAPEIDHILGLTPRQRDYLQQRFKYHVEKFARTQQWKLVHQWLGADVDQNLGLSPRQWEIFLHQLTPEQQQLLQLKRNQASDEEIIRALKCTPKQMQKRWQQLLESAWQVRNQSPESQKA
ncbi:hypothetical protein BST81_23340 [Leptolyngbya sp. 'hensonii']|uniref:HetZ-related protein n=1 Tax=Leptolyngbya sp. 'hensonii' TaxID=1922337 RepID=UPI00094FC7CD|nr:HetZ-related protein [Leptolyngbya sp. 'hensonii']OLP16035.1 hypothetical protein BST81_23340 [Leptolyngbya sp. 'hensonii']